MPKGAQDAKIKREQRTLGLILRQLPANPIAWGAVIKIVGPIIARLAVRYALKKMRRNLSEEKVNQVGESVADWLDGVITEAQAKAGDILGGKESK